MTSTSGGNLSIREPDGGIWITPSRVDKGGLQPTDTRDIQGFFLVVNLVAARGEAEPALTQHRHRALGLLEIGGTAAREADADAEGLQSCGRSENLRGRLDRLPPVVFGLERAMPAALIAAPSIPPGKKSPTLFSTGVAPRVSRRRVRRSGAGFSDNDRPARPPGGRRQSSRSAARTAPGGTATVATRAMR